MVDILSFIKISKILYIFIYFIIIYHNNRYKNVVEQIF
jgi:hypothetical protein